jgi:hypothetical protein
MTNMATILDALGKARAELAAYREPGEHNAEVTIAKLVGILEHREVVQSLQALAPKRVRAAQPKPPAANDDAPDTPTGTPIVA